MTVFVILLAMFALLHLLSVLGVPGLASGKTKAETLRAENPRHFFDSAEDLGAMMDAILKG